MKQSDDMVFLSLMQNCDFTNEVILGQLQNWHRYTYSCMRWKSAIDWLALLMKH